VFSVDWRVLIPRPETELLTEIASGFLKDISRKTAKKDKIFADWCTGSGCIGITLLLENPGWRCVAVDSNVEALQMARENAVSHGVLRRMKFIRCSNPSEAPYIALEPIDLIVANPPYIKTEDIALLEEQVRCYEPVTALDGGADGLDIFRVLLSGLPALMNPGALLLFETGGGEQINDILAIHSSSPHDIEFIKDFPDHREIRRFMLWRKLRHDNKIKLL
jgi:release factor glutamine methyltransferase